MGFMFRVLVVGVWVLGLGFWFRVWFRVLGMGFCVLGFRLRVLV